MFETYVVLMTELNGSDDLKDMFPGHLLLQTTGVLLQLLQDGVVHILEHQVQLPLPPEHLDKNNFTIQTLSMQ